ncbi:protein MIS12 homolog [Hemicordylus capensis]|uniref:protein MIS12 homolog n=1 Tax=Hemicordylus capensis TaxID=884348 RepID=UPI002303DAC1|nr:protein MIS12 homolog [Hemicordylus capensis]
MWRERAASWGRVATVFLLSSRPTQGSQEISTPRVDNLHVRMSDIPMVYETQFFGFTPQTCMLRIYIAFQDHLFHMMLVVEEVILKKLENMSHLKVTPSLIRMGTEKFLSVMKEHFNLFFGKMEQMLLQIVLSIPKNVLHLEDKVQEKFNHSAAQFQDLQKEIGALEQQVKAETAAEQALRAELEEQKAVQVHLEKTLQWFDSLDSVCRAHGTSNLKESLAFLKKTSHKLQDIVREVDKHTTSQKQYVGQKEEVGEQSRTLPHLDQ